MTSADGTVIGYTRHGDGPPVILAGGGLDDGTENAPLAEALAAHRAQLIRSPVGCAAGGPRCSGVLPLRLIRLRHVDRGLPVGAIDEGNDGMTLDVEVRDRVDATVAQAIEEGQVPGVVAAVARGEAVHVATAGASAVGGPPMARDTLFRITSMSKPITAAAVLSLADDGVLDLDEPVDRLLPELADRRVLRRPDGPLDDTMPALRSPLVRELLTFTWGFGLLGAMLTAEQPWPIVAAATERQVMTFGPPQSAAAPDPDTWLARLGELPLVAPPGERWLYHTGSQVLGVLAARAASMPFPDVLRERVLDPLGMRDTAYTAETGRLATAYALRDGRLVETDPPGGQWSRPPAFPDGGDGLVSSVDDLVAFGRMLARGGAPVLRPETAAAMTGDQLTREQRARVWPGFDMLLGRGWGFGVSVLDDGGYSWHGGQGTAWWNVPAQDLTVVVLTQREFDENGPPAVCDKVLAAARPVRQ